MLDRLPVLILLTDDTPSRNGAGIRQTLYNLLECYPAPIFQLSFPDEVQGERQAAMLRTTIVLQPAGPYRPWSNRLGGWVNRFLQPWQLAWLARASICHTCLPATENSLVLVSTSSVQKLVLAGNLQSMGYRVVPYFMDDWMAGNTLRWKGDTLQQLIARLLANAPGWLMISNNLKRELMQRYQLAEKPCLVVHNPAPAPHPSPRWGEAGGATGNEVPINGLPDLPSPSGGVGGGLIIYAGSIWPMHADALKAVVEALQYLRKMGHTTIQLQLFSSEKHWMQYRHWLQDEAVEWKGWVPYDELPAKLAPARFLLCASSFEAQYQAYSRSSVQTKITDYMAIGKPILFVGPADAASGQFVEHWNCGYTLNAPQANQLSKALQAVWDDADGYEQKVERCRQLATTEFSQRTVQKRLYEWLGTLKNVDKPMLKARESIKSAG